ADVHLPAADRPALGHWRAGLPPVGLYTLRHTRATLLLPADQPAKVVSERLRHSSVTLALDTSSHVLPTVQEAGGRRDGQDSRGGAEGAKGAGVFGLATVW